MSDSTEAWWEQESHKEDEVAEREAQGELAALGGSAPPRFYWKQCYEMGDAVHWALCDSHTDAQGPPARVTTVDLVVLDHWHKDYADRRLPKLIVELLNAHFAQNE